jgi:hypothetical protein
MKKENGQKIHFLQAALVFMSISRRTSSCVLNHDEPVNATDTFAFFSEEANLTIFHTGVKRRLVNGHRGSAPYAFCNGLAQQKGCRPAV